MFIDADLRAMIVARFELVGTEETPPGSGVTRHQADPGDGSSTGGLLSLHATAAGALGRHRRSSSRPPRRRANHHPTRRYPESTHLPGHYRMDRLELPH